MSMSKKLFVALSTSAGLLLFVLPSSADAPTHRLSLSAESIKTDCAKGQCSVACSFKGTLTNLGPSASVALSVALWYVTDANDAKQSAASLDFASLDVGQSQTTEAEAYFYTCDNVVMKGIEVLCPESGPNEKCPHFYNVEILSLKTPKINKQVVEGK
jgi:hypothetical protein